MPSAQAYALSERLKNELCEAQRLLRSLPSLKPEVFLEDEMCPICLNSFHSILSDDPNGSRKNEELDANCLLCKDVEKPCTHGVVKLEACGHIFCRMDLSEWLDSLHGTCPTCRTPFFKFTQYSDADLESSDGGEYIPDDDEMDDDEYEFEDELDEVDYDAFPTPDSLEIENGDQWRQVVGSPSETGTRAFRPARDVLSQAVAYEGDDYSSDWMEEDTALSSSAGDMTEGSDDPTSEELSSNNGDRVQDDDTEIFEDDELESHAEVERELSPSYLGPGYDGDNESKPDSQ